MDIFDMNIPDTQDAIARAGFRDVERALQNFEELAGSEVEGQLPDDFFQMLIDAPDPDMALNNFVRVVQAIRNRTAFLHTLETQPELCRMLLCVLGGSPFMADMLVRDPEIFDWLTDAPDRIAQSSEKEQLLASFDRAVEAVDTREDKLNAVRRSARRELLRIGVGDLAGGRAIQNVAADLSVLADVCLQKLIDILLPDLHARYGMPKNADGQRVAFAIFGMGKLGGMELNFSSDIDLMFVYGAEGNTDGERSVTNQEFFSRLCEQIVRAATEVTPEGFLYRTDMRLRPDGAAGALVMPLAGYEGYYMRRGELWERQMLIKARCCAGSEHLGQRFLRMVEPFVFPRYFDTSRNGDQPH